MTDGHVDRASKEFDARSALATFVLAWSRVATVLEACLSQELRLSHQQASILLDGVTFEDRMSMLRTALLQNGDPAKDKLELIDYMKWLIPKSKLASCRCEWDGADILFYTDYDEKAERYESRRMSAVELIQLSKTTHGDGTQLQVVFGIGSEVLDRYYNR